MKKIVLPIVLAILALGAQAQWISQPAGFATPVMVYEMEAINQSVVWAAGSDTINTPGQTYVKSTDGGLTWQSGAINNAQDFIINNITATDASTAWVVMVDEINGGGMVKKTTDGGLTWTTQGTNAFTDPASYPDVIHFCNASSGVVFGDPVGNYWEVYTTSDGGNNWTRLPLSSVPNVISGGAGDEYGMFAKATIGDTIWVGTSEGRVFRSANKGLSWIAANTPLPFIQAIAFTDAANGLAMSSTGELATTSDGGLTWTSTMYQGDLFDYDMAALPGAPGTFVTTGFNNAGYAGSSFTIDGGNTWIALDSMPHMAVAFADRNTGWTSGMNSRVSYSWSSSVLGTSKPIALQEAVLYPNPSTGIFFIKDPSAYLSLIVTDITGRQVFSASNFSQDNSLDLNFLSKGVYQVLLQASDSVSIQKLVIQ